MSCATLTSTSAMSSSCKRRRVRPRRRAAASHEPPPAESMADAGMPVTPPPVDSPKAESRVPQSVRNAVSSRLSLTTLCDWPPYALAIIAVAKPPTVPAIWPPSSVSASPPPLNNDASKSELTVEAVDAAVSGSIPCSEAPPTTDDMRPSAPLCESSDKVSGFALSVETVLKT